MRRSVFILLMIVSSVSWAGWEITSTDDEATFYHNKSTIRKTGSIARMWTMTNYAEVQTNSRGEFTSDKVLVAFDCRSETYAIVSVSRYSDQMGSGSVVYSYTNKESKLEWNPIVPDSLGKNEWNIACGKK